MPSHTTAFAEAIFWKKLLVYL